MDFYRLSPAQQAQAMRGLADAALGRWGIGDANISLLKLRENAVFRIDVPAAGSRVMRIHRYQYHSDAHLLSELQWMQALRASGIEAPEVIASAAGCVFEVVHADSVPGPRQVDMLGWMRGRPLGAIGETLSGDAATLRRTFRLLGRLVAQVHNQAVAWQAPAGFRRHEWDAPALAGERPFWGRFWELDALTSSQRHLLQRARSRVQADLLNLGKSAGTYSMIHADLVPENILIEGDTIRLIDFDDAGFGWHQFEIATALFFQLGRPYFGDIRDALIGGYRERRSLSDEAIDQLPLFFLARSFTYLAWAHTRFETELAQQITPTFVEMGCALADSYLSR